jgi:hypothetical protein
MLCKCSALGPSRAVNTFRSRRPGRYGQGVAAVRKNLRFLVGKGFVTRFPWSFSAEFRQAVARISRCDGLRNAFALALLTYDS